MQLTFNRSEAPAACVRRALGIGLFLAQPSTNQGIAVTLDLICSP